MVNLIREKKLRVLIVSFITGIILSIIEFVIIRFMMEGTTEWTIEMGNILFNVMLALSLITFVLTGLIFFRNMTRKEIAISATIVIGYYIFFLLFERIVVGAGNISLMNLYLLMAYPLRLYTTITQIVIRILNINVWVGVLLSLLSPSLYMVFGKKNPIDEQ